jgi:hypothetical protein
VINELERIWKEAFLDKLWGIPKILSVITDECHEEFARIAGFRAEK